MLLQVHDELVFETPRSVAEAEAEMIRTEMIAAGPELKIEVPLKVEVGWGDTWGAIK
jgi:DNA polymerase-1